MWRVAATEGLSVRQAAASPPASRVSPPRIPELGGTERERVPPARPHRFAVATAIWVSSSLRVNGFCRYASMPAARQFS